ncbi:hypothetical protein LTR62_001980 [Meristemomyces frigidus]|uniref:Bifunctional cytochrome P450/NADPH--P450 reductase n=1 Tax=Meristemomyces frigidus TaxID=1508187 RepID=A0AAN7YHV9_9PEZI|nr:hypothetical protein LTR62_001980 [Meristemomyces frigidus]
MDIRDSVPIPQPTGWPVVGNLSEIDPELPLRSLRNLAKTYGEIYSLTIFGKQRVVISSQRLLAELCDEKRFGKIVAASLAELRHGTHDGLFTAQNEEQNWHLAHRVLVPAFGPLNIAGMFDDMKDIASQLVLKLARYGPGYKMPVAEDFTRLTLDTLALCAMDYRFNSFYTDEQHPFISSMVNFLRLGDARSRRPTYLTPFYRADDAQFFKDIEYMRNLSQEIVDRRVEHPEEKKDLLNAMILGRDPKTRQSLSKGTIIDNMITFLIAGHETTSGLLSFLFYYLIKHPETIRKAQAEVDQVIGKQSIEAHHVNELPYVTACLRETLRLQPTAPAFTTHALKKEGEILGGKYFLGSDIPIVALLPEIHRDPTVYGDDADVFKPERMLDENFNKLPPGAWKPFGNGARGCIGRPFAWQEAMMVAAMLLQYFDFTADPNYELAIKQTLTIKPKDWFMYAKLREGWTATKVEQSLSGSVRSGGAGDPGTNAVKPLADGKPITVLYGSNSGTCEAFAQIIAADAATHGYKADVKTLDEATQHLPEKQPTVIITASYEGAPCDNAARFYDWLVSLKESDKVDATYAVFGCGHSDWKATFHKIPNSIDTILEAHGAQRLCQRGSADAAKGDMMSVFQTWEDEQFWPSVRKAFGGDDAAQPTGSGQTLEVTVTSRRASTLRADVSEAKVLACRTLTAPDVPEKRHIELQLPSDMTYRSGDYLAVLPVNPPESIHRVMVRFSLPWDAMLTFSSKSNTVLPTDAPISAHNLFAAYVELSQPATKRSVNMLIEASKDTSTKTELQTLLTTNFDAHITQKRISLLDLLEQFPIIDLPLGAFIASLISMRVRQYSISSSPLADPHKCTLTYSVLESASLAGKHHKHLGVASHYLSQLIPGDIVHVAVKPSHQAFHPPVDAEKTPVLMFAAGTGLAPFRSFVQERAAQIGAGRTLAPAYLYYGCRDPEKDLLYSSELERWEKMGAVKCYYAFSQAPEASNGFKHVDDVMREKKEELLGLWDAGARVFVCGSRGLGEAVREAVLEMASNRAESRGKRKTREEVEGWFDGVRNERFATDVFD